MPPKESYVSVSHLSVRRTRRLERSVPAGCWISRTECRLSSRWRLGTELDSDEARARARSMLLAKRTLEARHQMLGNSSDRRTDLTRLDAQTITAAAIRNLASLNAGSTFPRSISDLEESL